jgi:hypothetical protein
MSAPVRFDPAPTVFDLSEPPPATDKDGRLAWSELCGQLHVLVTRLQARILRLEEEVSCDTCGCLPCANPSFCRACQTADARRRRTRR